MKSEQEYPFRQLLAELDDSMPAVACEAVHRLKAISKQDSAALYDIRKSLIRVALQTDELRVRWNLIIILGRLPLKGRDRAVMVDWLFERLSDVSSLTRTFAMQGLADLSNNDPMLRRGIIPVIQQFSMEGTAAMRVRARKLLRKMEDGMPGV